jgi:hypothetical protein
MDTIPCEDIVDGTPFTIPGGPKRANPDSIKDRWVQFVYCMDLSQAQGDEEPGNAFGAWCMWGLPITHCAQIDDDRGDDLICVSILNRVYFLDHTVYRDEWAPNEFAPIYKMMRIGPIPSAEADVPKGGWNPNSIKRFVEFFFPVKERASQGALSRWRISVAEQDREGPTQKITMRQASQRMKIGMTTQGKKFVVTLEHAANEPIEIDHWQAVWDDIGVRIRCSPRVL